MPTHWSHSPSCLRPLCVLEKNNKHIITMFSNVANLVALSKLGVESEPERSDKKPTESPLKVRRPLEKSKTTLLAHTENTNSGQTKPPPEGRASKRYSLASFDITPCKTILTISLVNDNTHSILITHWSMRVLYQFYCVWSVFACGFSLRLPRTLLRLLMWYIILAVPATSWAWKKLHFILLHAILLHGGKASNARLAS